MVESIEPFDTSAWKGFYPRVDVCARAKRGWKGHTRLKSPSRSRIETYFSYDVYKAWFSACFFTQACTKWTLVQEY